MSDHPSTPPRSDGYGGEVETVYRRDESGEVWQVVHTGDPEHGSVPIGEQCRCGWINFGVVLDRETE